MGAADSSRSQAEKDNWFTSRWADPLNYTNISRHRHPHTPVTFEQSLTLGSPGPRHRQGMSNMTANSVLTNSVQGGLLVLPAP